MEFMYVFSVHLISGTESANLYFDLYVEPEDMLGVVRSLFNEKGDAKYKFGEVLISKIKKAK